MMQLECQMVHKEEKSIVNKVKKTLYLLISLLIGLLLYIFLHELGHLIVMLYAGAKIIDFSIVTTHVTAIGGNYSNLSNLWLHVNGMLFPEIVSIVYMLFYKKENSSSFYHIFSYIASLLPVCSGFAWVIVPLIYIQGNVPVHDDVTMFLHSFTQNYHPLIVSVVAMFIIATSASIMVKKGIVKNFIVEMRKQ